MQTLPTDLKERISAALTDSDSELWFPNLTYDLVQSGYQKLHKDIGITIRTYGTARVILKDVDAERLAEIFIKNTIFSKNGYGQIENETFVEIFPANIVEQYKESGVEFYNQEELLTRIEIINCLKNSFETIRSVPSLFETVRRLVKSIHLIKPEDDEYDVSFSEPHIPFSIFVSVPRENTPINVLRVTEAIVHESMHLQLTLIENIVPLFSAEGNLVYSPWKEEYRTPQGILHALYVFKVIEYFVQQVSKNNNLSTECKHHLKERQNRIFSQVHEISDFLNCPNLTNLGKKFTEKLMEFS